MIVLLLIGFMLIVMLMRVVVPIGQRLEGRPLGEVRLGLLQRFQWQRTNMYATGLVLLLGTWGGWLSGALEAMVLIAVFAILLMPVRYIFTTDGVAVNNVIFRHWDEFASFRVQGGRINLEDLAGRKAFTLFIAPRDQTEVIRLLQRRLVQRVAKKEVRQHA